MDPRLNLAPERRLIMTFALRQSLEILQMSQLELSQYLQNEIEKNPLLELDPPRHKKRFEFDLPALPTLHEHLQTQIRENFSSPKDRRMAADLVNHLDERGFLTLETADAKILSVLQTFDPPGIFARNLQEALLLQLKAKGKENALSFALIQNCFEDLLHGRYTNIKKKLKSSDLTSAMRDLVHLSFRPANAFKREPSCPIHPDLHISKIEGGWTLQLIEDELPPFHIQTEYLNLEPKIAEERESLREFKTQAKWIFRSLSRRRKLLLDIGRILVCKQSTYLDQKGPLVALTTRELAEKLAIHESTLSRALAGKYASTPRGIIPLRALLSATPAAETAREILERLVSAEDKQNPLTDSELSKALKSNGFCAARRTIAKYRTQLKIGSTSQRKNVSR